MNKEDFIKYSADVMIKGHIWDDYWQYMKDRHANLKRQLENIKQSGDKNRLLKFTKYIFGLVSADECALMILTNKAKHMKLDPGYIRFAKGYVNLNIKPGNQALVDFRHDYRNGREKHE